MDDDLPTEYDVIVVGTGMTESIVAAAASRIGKRVLHIDSNEYYGGLWASFNFECIQKWIEDFRKPTNKDSTDEKDFSNILKNGENIVMIDNKYADIKQINSIWNISEENSEPKKRVSSDTQTDDNQSINEDPKTEDEKDKINKPKEETEKSPPQLPQWSQKRILRDYRKFNLDLAPKLLLARGNLVELLISSNIARYAEFRSVTRVLTWLGSRLELVPCSRADVFATRHVSVVEKRMLMKLLATCLEQQQIEAENQTFGDWLRSRRLTDNLIHYVVYAIAMSTPSISAEEGLARTRRFLESLGRYGNTPFLWPMYGSGELPQCFCRLCAVFGGVYHLKRSIEAIIVDPNEAKAKAIISSGRRLECQQLILGPGFSPGALLEKKETSLGLQRGIFITNRSILTSEKEQLTLLQFPPLDGVPSPVTVIELGSATNACPAGLYVVHMTCHQREKEESPESALASIVAKLFRPGEIEAQCIDSNSQTHAQGHAEASSASHLGAGDTPSIENKPQVLWSLYFQLPDTITNNLKPDGPNNIHLCSGPDVELDFDFAVEQAKEIFSKIFPTEEFLQRAPDPEEIVFDGEEAESGATNDSNKVDTTQIEVEVAVDTLESIQEALNSIEQA